MDVLNDRPEPRVHASPLARGAWLATLLLAAACPMLQRTGEPAGPRFNHALHEVAAGFACDSCHRGAETEDEAGMPPARQCVICHKDLDADKPPEKQASILYDGDAVKSAHVSEQSEEIIFSHKVHVTQYSIACAECHGDVSSTVAVPASTFLTMDACIRCHEQRTHRKDDCSVCHKEIRADRQPEDHANDWRRVHGQKVRARGGAEPARCTLCHDQKRDCVACHLDEAPQDHTNYWRERGHGIAVGIDRSRCATCHQTDMCVRCHQDTAPLTHVASFGSPFDRHCLTCHTPLQGEGCYVCHKSTPSHALAPPLPSVPPHVPGMNCRMCHGLSVPLIHADNGSSCDSCHH